MSYSFDNVMSMLGKGPKQQDKADIFGGQSGGGAQGAQGGLGSSTEGELGGASGGGDVANAKSGTAQAPSDVSSSAAFRSNIGKTAAPNLGAIKNGVDSKNQALDNEANTYLTNRADLQPDKLSDSDVDQLHGAIDKGYTAKPSGDGPTPFETGAQPRDSIGYWSSVANGQVEKVDPFKSAVDLKDSTVENLGTDAGVQNLLRQGQNAEYNIGDAAFDGALLGQDQTFQQGRQDIMDRYHGVQNKQNTMGDEVTKKAQQASDSARGSYLADLKSKLGGFQSQFTDEAMKQERDLEESAGQRQIAMLNKGSNYVSDEAKALGGVAADPMASFYSGEGVDPSKFVTGNFDRNTNDWKSYLNDDQALRFNNIFSLLGSKDIYGKGNKAGGIDDSELVNYDKAGLDAALQGGAKTRSEAATAKSESERQAVIQEEQKKQEGAKKAATEDANWAETQAAHEAADDKSHISLGDAASPGSGDFVGSVARETKPSSKIYDQVSKLSAGKQLSKFYRKKQKHW